MGENIQGKNGSFLGGNSPEGSLIGGNFPGGGFPDTKENMCEEFSSIHSVHV